MSLVTFAEQQADAATKLQGMAINLEEVRRSVKGILSMFGKGLIFSEYTMHDISHIDDMLSTCEWIIPAQTKAVLSRSEWLMIVLSIYFHDMGLIVTEAEYKSRDRSKFKTFCEDILFAGPGGGDYKAKINRMEEDVAERFLYQEFVRYHHGARVRGWIEGKLDPSLGYAEAQVGEINRLLSPLSAQFRRDLGLVCESHNLDDIMNVDKYKTSFPYGNGKDYDVNLQYCAILLRTIDLIQITSGRAPSVLFRLVSPVDPVSQLEWAKQRAVFSVRSRAARDRDGALSPDVQPDTIEVFASFSDPDGYFGLTSYLRYASEQIAASYDAMERSRRDFGKKYQFPWRYIDDSQVEVEGFIKKQFSFEIDQEKVLNLLIGHTLYNDSSVVVRELTQNALDAARLQAQLDGSDSSKSGLVTVTWNSSAGELTIADNGTGMTQETIEKHLLTVGSSRYQDPKFREENPLFNPISRFGIGVLTSFMVADEVEILTVAVGEQARRVSLRSVHGRYLIRLLGQDDPEVRGIGEHGTVIRLRFRPSAKKLDVLATLRRWVVVPRCRVHCIVDDRDPLAIGYESPKAALEAYVSSKSVANLGSTKVIFVERAGLQIAFALTHNAHYKDWHFLRVPKGREKRSSIPIGTCVEGIAVEFVTPGYSGQPLVALVNAIGPNAPRTNVARSALEITSDREHLVETFYQEIFASVSKEAERLVSTEGYSLTWAAEQIPFLVAPALDGTEGHPTYPAVHKQALQRLPMFLAESEEGRRLVSLEDLSKKGEFWTVEAYLMQYLENFIREAKSEISATQLLSASQSASASLPTGTTVTNIRTSGLLHDLVDESFEVTHLRAVVADRRVDLKWSTSTQRWIDAAELARRLQAEPGFAQLGANLAERRNRHGRLRVPLDGVTVEGAAEYMAIAAQGVTYLNPDSPFCSLVRTWASSDLDDPVAVARVAMLMTCISAAGTEIFNRQGFDRFIGRYDELPKDVFLFKDSLMDLLSNEPNMSTYDPLSWSQRDPDRNAYAVEMDLF